MKNVFKRKTYQKLLDWKNNNCGRTAILLEGPRRVGKTTLIEQFVKNEYKTFIMINFSDPSEDVMDIFKNGFSPDPNLFFFRLQKSTGIRLYERKSAIVFDEVQRYPKARELIKHLVADGRYDYIETGSLVSIKENVKDIVIPSEEESIKLHPMDFEEYLWAKGDDFTIPMIREKFTNRQPVGNQIHRTLISEYREYMIVGGMPEAVSTYLETKDLEKTDAVKKRILELYSNDIEKSKTPEKTSLVFNSIPGMLANHNKMFSPSELSSDSRTRDYINSIEWLKKSGTTNICYNCSDPTSAMMLSVDLSSFKHYMADTGLLITKSFMTKDFTEGEVYKALLFNHLEINEGMYFENMVAQELRALGYDLFMCEFRDNDDDLKKKKMEVDFLLIKGKKIVPIEVKSNRSDMHKSLDIFISKYHSRITESFVIHSKDLKQENGITYIPIYMTMFL